MYQAYDRMNHILVDLPNVPSAVMHVFAREIDRECRETLKITNKLIANVLNILQL